MSHHIEPNTGFFGLMLSLFLMLVSFAAPEVAEPINHQWQFPIWVMQSFQLMAWSCVGGTFVITFFNHLGIKINIKMMNPFKKKEK